MAPAPYGVRERWVGVTLSPKEVIDGELFLVSKEEALRALEKNSPAAAAWFRENLPERDLFLTFDLYEVEIVG